MLRPVQIDIVIVYLFHLQSTKGDKVMNTTTLEGSIDELSGEDGFSKVLLYPEKSFIKNKNV